MVINKRVLSAGDLMIAEILINVLQINISAEKFADVGKNHYICTWFVN